LLFLFCSTVPFIASQDSYCPSYPTSDRVAFQQSFEAATEYTSYLREADDKGKKRSIILPPAKNLVDEAVFAKMSRDGVEPAAVTADTQFLRRIYLDLTGKIPTYDQAQAFL